MQSTMGGCAALQGVPDPEPGIIIVCSCPREDGYYYTQSFDRSGRGLTDDRNAPVRPTIAPVKARHRKQAAFLALDLPTAVCGNYSLGE
jgi:hypothetical protein